VVIPEARQDLEMALKEYEILEQSAHQSNHTTWTIAGLFAAGFSTALAILTRELIQANSRPQLTGYFFVSVAIVLCLWFWFYGIHLRLRAHNAIIYHLLGELEKDLGFKAHSRIQAFDSGDAKRKPWYCKLIEVLCPFLPWRPNVTTWLFVILLIITLAYIASVMVAIIRCL